MVKTHPVHDTTSLTLVNRAGHTPPVGAAVKANPQVVVAVMVQEPMIGLVHPEMLAVVRFATLAP
ncbi:hypothetical protein CCO04_04140 [Pimelobacter sp. 30-1]|nr:hypothetical protein [Pimelobacter sp. 30-1]